MQFWKIETAYKVRNHIHVYISLFSLAAFGYLSLTCDQEMKELAYLNNGRPAFR